MHDGDRAGIGEFEGVVEGVSEDGERYGVGGVEVEGQRRAARWRGSERVKCSAFMADLDSSIRLVTSELSDGEMVLRDFTASSILFLRMIWLLVSRVSILAFVSYCKLLCSTFNFLP